MSKPRINLVEKSKSFIFKSFLAILFLISQPALSLPQSDSKGTDFWLMFNDNLGTPTLSLFIAGDTATTGNVDIPGLAFTAPFAVTPGVVTTVVLPASAAVTTLGVVGKKGIHVTAKDEVSVYGLNQVTYTTDAYLGLPTDILGTEYIVQGYENVDVVNASQLGVVAAVDNTVVTITPSTATSDGKPAGVPFSVTMSQGQTYQLRTTASGGADLSGSIVTSDKPVAVFGGHQCANIPRGYIACDHIVEQMTPTSTWGQSFVTLPLATRTGGDTFRVQASNDVTTVSVNGAVVVTLNRGENYETILVSASTITSDKPISVTQYSNSSAYDGITSDPFEVIVPPSEQYLAGYVVTTPATGFSKNYINVVAPDAAVGSITLDAVVIPASDFSPIGSSGYSGAQVSVVLGSHTLSGALPFGITMYGFANYDSYGYPGGLALAEVAELTDLALTPETAINPINTEHCVVASTLDQNSDPLPGIRVDFGISGANTVSGFEFTNANGDAQFCYTGLNAGTDTIVASVGKLTDTATKIWTELDVRRCDVDGNGQVDKIDIRAIMARRNLPATGPDDPADADGNGVIDANDARQCVLQCTFDRCATS